MRFFVIALIMALALTGCKTTPPNDATSATPAPVVDGQTNTVTTGTLSDYQPVERPGYDTNSQNAQANSGNYGQPGNYAGVSSDVFSDTSNPLSIRSIYFDFDNYSVREEYRPAVMAHAKFLQDNPDAKMLIQGNTDERGTREYNLVLGQRRSDAVREMLLMLGAKEEQIESVSLGEENPYSAAGGEAAYEQNRRADLLYRYKERQEF